MKKTVKVIALILVLAVAATPLVEAAAGSVVTLINGTSSAPALAFESSKGTGLYYGGSHSTVFTSNRVAKLTIGTGITASADVTMSAGAEIALDTGTATATTGAATLSKQSGVVTSEALTTAAGSSYTLTLTNTLVAATSRVFASVQNGTNTQGELTVTSITPGSGSVAIVVKNSHGSQALNGTIKISFLVAP
jgi:hypothetical protein